MRVQGPRPSQTAVFYLVDTIGMFLGVSFAVWIGVPRFGGAQAAGLGIILFGIANATFVLIWTDRTPGNDIACVLFLLGIGSGLLLAGISLLCCFCLAVAAASIVGCLPAWEIAINHPAIRGWNNLDAAGHPRICLQNLRSLRSLQHPISRRQNCRWK